MDTYITGAVVRELREKRGLTQAQLAEMLHISDKTVSKWETGRGLPEVSIMQSLCATLGITVNELLSGQRLDDAAWRNKAEENLTVLMRPKRYKDTVLHFAVSTGQQEEWHQQ